MSVELRGMDQVQRVVARFQDLALRPAPLLEAMGQVLLDDGVMEAFNAGRGPWGQQWKPLASSTLNSFVPGTRRRRRSYGTKPLVRRRHLQSSFNVESRGRKSVSIGTPFEHAKYHQAFDDNPPGKGIIPERPFMPTQKAGRWPPRIQSGMDEAVDTLIEAMQRA